MPPRSRRLRQRQLAKENEEAEAPVGDDGLAAEEASNDAAIAEGADEPEALTEEDAPVEVDWPDTDDDGVDSDELAIDLDESEAPDLDDPSTDAYRDDVTEQDDADEAASPPRRDRSSRRRSRVGDGDEAEGDTAGRSSRRSGRRSARTSAKKSARKSRKARQPVDPEAAAARKRAIATVLMIVLGFAVVGGGGYYAYIALHEEPQRIEVQLSDGPREFVGTKSDLARKLLEGAKFNYRQLQGAITGNQPSEAEQAQADAIALLNQPVLGNAQMSDPRPDDETLGSVELAREAFKLLQDIEKKDRDIARVRNRQRAQANLATLEDRLGNISAEVDLDVLEKNARDFIENPVDPESGVALVEDKDLFVKYVERIRNRLDEIVTERGRREKANTTTVVTQANNETDRLIAESRYSDALSAVDNLAQQYPDASLQAVRQKVLNAAEQAWQAARESAKNLYSRATAASTEQGYRASSLQEAVGLLENVTQNFGSAPEFSSYVSEAREILAKYRQTNLD